MIARVSEIEMFRQWREDEEFDLATLIARLRGEVPPSDEMLAGTAFHKALETASEGEFETLSVDGYTFHFFIDVNVSLPSIREMRSQKVYSVDGEPFTVTGQTDIIDGKSVEDHKTTRQFDPERYFSGYQWRFYLDINNGDKFKWNVYELHKNEKEEKTYLVKAVHFPTQYRYPKLQEDCQALAEDFYRFAKVHLPERFNQKEAA